MTTLLEAARKALALNAWTHFGECRATDGPIPTPAEVDAALRQAIEQAEQAQPVGVVESAAQGCGGFHVRLSGGAEMPSVGDALYTSPPPRQPLTSDEIDDIANDYSDEFGMIAPDSWEDFARAILKVAHGIKGEA